MDQLKLLRRHRKTFAFVVLLITTAAVVLTLLTPPTYAAQIKILITDDEAMQSDLTRFYSRIDRDFCQTQAEIVTSIPVAEEVVNTLKLIGRVPPVTPVGRVMGALGWLGRTLLPGGPGGEAPSPRLQVEAAVKSLQSRLQVQVVRNTQILVVTVEDWEPARAQAIADAVGQGYLARTRRLRRGNTHVANQNLTESLRETSQKLVAAENDLRAFEDRNQAAHLDVQVKHIVENRTVTLRGDHATAEKALGEEKARVEVTAAQLVEQYKKLMSGQLAGVVSSLKLQLAVKQGELTRLLLSYTPEHPDIQKLKQEILTTESQLAVEQNLQHTGKTQAADRVTEDLETTLNTARQAVATLTSRRNTLQQQLRELEAQLKTLLGKSTRHAILAREVDALLKLHNALLVRQKEVAAKELTISAIGQLLENASYPRLPTKPQKLLNLALGVMFGCLAGVALVFVLDHLDTSVRSGEEVAALLGLPILGIISSKAVLKGLPGQPERVSWHEPTSVVAETFKALRTTLQEALPSPSHRIILITSSQPGEGKTMVASNLAICLAQSGARVLLMDCDLRRPRVGTLWNVPRNDGTEPWPSAMRDELVHATPQENLWVLPAPAVSGDPGRLLGDPQLRVFLSELRSQFDRIIIDSAPVNPVSDSLLLALLAESTLLVVCAEEVRQPSLMAAYERLKGVQARLGGVVMNNLDRTEDRYESYVYAR